MVLKKAYASYRGEDGEIVPQRDVDMHPLEEEATLAHWAIHDERIKIPSKPTQADEHEWLIEHGAEYVKQKRIEWKSAYDTLYPNVEKAEALFQQKHNAWNDHVMLCHANGVDYDTFDGDAREKLTMPIKEDENAS